MEYYTPNTPRKEPGHDIWYQSSSDPRELLETTAESRFIGLTRTLIVTVDEIRVPVNIEVLRRVFAPCGAIEKISILPSKDNLAALVTFKSPQSAHSAKISLDRRYIFDQGCFMHINFWTENLMEKVREQTISIERTNQEIVESLKIIALELDKMMKSLPKPLQSIESTANLTKLERVSTDVGIQNLDEELNELVPKEVAKDTEQEVFSEMARKELKELKAVKTCSQVFDETPVKDFNELREEETEVEVFDDISTKEFKRFDSENIDNIIVIEECHQATTFKEISAPATLLEKSSTDVGNLYSKKETKSEKTMVQGTAVRIMLCVFDEVPVRDFRELAVIDSATKAFSGMSAKESKEWRTKKLDISFQVNNSRSYNQDGDESKIVAIVNMIDTTSRLIVMRENEETWKIVEGKSEGQYTFGNILLLHNCVSLIVPFIFDPGGNRIFEYQSWLFKLLYFESDCECMDSRCFGLSSDMRSTAKVHALGFDENLKLKNYKCGVFRLTTTSLISKTMRQMEHCKWGDQSGFDILIPLQNGVTFRALKGGFQEDTEFVISLNCSMSIAPLNNLDSLSWINITIASVFGTGNKSCIASLTHLTMLNSFEKISPNGTGQLLRDLGEIEVRKLEGGGYLLKSGATSMAKILKSDCSAICAHMMKIIECNGWVIKCSRGLLDQLFDLELSNLRSKNLKAGSISFLKYKGVSTYSAFDIACKGYEGVITCSMITACSTEQYHYFVKLMRCAVLLITLHWVWGDHLYIALDKEEDAVKTQNSRTVAYYSDDLICKLAKVKLMLKISCHKALGMMGKWSVSNSMRVTQTEYFLCLAKIVETEERELRSYSSRMDITDGVGHYIERIKDELLRLIEYFDNPIFLAAIIKPLSSLANTFPAKETVETYMCGRFSGPKQFYHSNQNVATQSAISFGKLTVPGNFLLVEAHMFATEMTLKRFKLESLRTRIISTGRKCHDPKYGKGVD